MLMVISHQEIREVRIFSGLSQKAFAERHGWKQATVAQWETGRRHPQYDHLVKLAMLYDEMKKLRSRKCRTPA